MQTPDLDQGRYFLKDYVRQVTDFLQVDQRRGLPPPPVEKPFEPDAVRIDLPPIDELEFEGDTDLIRIIASRKSRRRYAPEPLNLKDLSFYLACEWTDAAVCAVAAYDQDAMDRLLGVDGDEEFTIYLAAAGKRPN